jgi:hypothetical protein
VRGENMSPQRSPPPSADSFNTGQLCTIDDAICICWWNDATRDAAIFRLKTVLPTHGLFKLQCKWQRTLSQCLRQSTFFPHRSWVHFQTHAAGVTPRTLTESCAAGLSMDGLNTEHLRLSAHFVSNGCI